MIYILRMRLLVKAWHTIRMLRTTLEAQSAVMDVYREGIALLQRQVLEERRERLALVNAWRISVEQPEVDLRDDLDMMIRSLADEVAQIGLRLLKGIGALHRLGIIHRDIKPDNLQLGPQGQLTAVI